jgi:hypothetical protein
LQVLLYNQLWGNYFNPGVSPDAGYALKTPGGPEKGIKKYDKLLHINDALNNLTTEVSPSAGYAFSRTRPKLLQKS